MISADKDVGFMIIILLNSSTNKKGSMVSRSHFPKSLFKAVRPGKFMFPVEYLEILYGGSVSIRSTRLSFICPNNFRQSPFIILYPFVSIKLSIHIVTSKIKQSCHCAIFIVLFSTYRKNKI